MTNICGFVKVFNEGDIEKGGTGNLKICLEQMKKVCDEIVVCDCESTDNSVEIAKQFTSHIISVPNVFSDELIHKQKLLELALSLSPKWLLFLDPDECCDARAAEGIKQLCEYGDEFNIDGFNLHTYNVWRNKAWLRTDSMFFDKWDVKLWRNTGKLKFNEVPGLHQKQHPDGLKRILPCNIQVIHLGFSTTSQIIRKWITYQSLGQSGWSLERLSPADTNIQLAPVDLSMYPAELRPLAEPPPKTLSKEEFDILLKEYEEKHFK